MSKKKKKDKIDPQIAREKEWLEQFECLGITKADEVYELIFENDVDALRTCDCTFKHTVS